MILYGPQLKAFLMKITKIFFFFGKLYWHSRGIVKLRSLYLISKKNHFASKMIKIIDTYPHFFFNYFGAEYQLFWFEDGLFFLKESRI